MEKNVVFSFLVIFLLFAGAGTVFAFVNFLPQFGGRIIDTTALEIRELEMSSYECVVPGATILISPIGLSKNMPTSYFIPFRTYSKTKNSLKRGQLIMGKYSGKTIINCELLYYPFTIVPVSLDTITIFGNSRW